MPQIINTNPLSLSTQRSLNQSQSTLQSAVQRLSSGLRINSSFDDAAGLAISERFTSQIRGLSQAARNSQDAISMSQVGEGAMTSIASNLQRMRELAVQAANGTNSQSERDSLNLEFDQLRQENNRIAAQTAFGGVKLLDGTFSGMSFQVGSESGESLSVSAPGNMTASALGSYAAATATQTGYAGANLLTAAGAGEAMLAIDGALTSVSSGRAAVGAIQSRFEALIGYLQSAGDNITASRSRVMDADFAQETTRLARAQILQDAGAAMLVQANATTQNVMNLLRSP